MSKSFANDYTIDSRVRGVYAILAMFTLLLWYFYGFYFAAGNL